MRAPGLATAIGVVAVLLWSCLALLTSFTEGIPAFELLSLSFGVAFAASLVLVGLRGRKGFRSWRQPWPVWATGFAGIFVYHALYFYALKAAPPAEASLIAYCWPLLIVLLSACSAGERLRARQLLGALLGFGGTVLIVQGGGQSGSGAAPVSGYVAALACAFVWAAYSVVNRRFSEVPSGMIGGICGLVALGGCVGHVAFEATVWPDRLQWAAIVGLGAGPVGVAFFAWDHATKHGRLPVLGALSYLAPLISTLLLIAAGRADASPALLVAALLVISGAVIAAARVRKPADALRQNARPDGR